MSLLSARRSPGSASAAERDRLSVLGGLAALSLDAMASVAYGPEAIVIVLAAGGGVALGFTLPVTLAIAALLGVLTLSYRQVIAAFPQGGGAYGVAKAYLGRRASLVAAASLVVDYVLNVAVSIAAGVAALTSAVPRLLPYTVWLCLGVLVLVTAVNLRGIAHSARMFIVPTAVFVLSVLAVVVAGLFRDHPVVTAHATAREHGLQTVGALLLLRAFAGGCAALTGVEAIANAVPSFRRPRVRRAQGAEVALGALLGVMLIGVSALITRFHIRPVPEITVLSQVTEGSLGHGIGYYVVQFATVVLLALAANTSFGGRAYRRIGERLELGVVPARPRPRRSLAIVPVGAVNRLTKEAISAALSLGDRVVAVRVTHPDEPEETTEFITAWERWAPDVNLALLNDTYRRLVDPIVDYVRGVGEPHVFVLIPEVEPAHIWQRVLQNQRGAVLAHALRRDTDAVVCRLRFRLDDGVRRAPGHNA